MTFCDSRPSRLSSFFHILPFLSWSSCLYLGVLDETFTSSHVESSANASNHQDTITSSPNHGPGSQSKGHGHKISITQSQSPNCNRKTSIKDRHQNLIIASPQIQEHHHKNIRTTSKLQNRNQNIASRRSPTPNHNRRQTNLITATKPQT